jgi:hypothetical protein
MSINPKYDRIVRDISALHERKVHDYAASTNPYSNFEFAAAVAKDFADPVDRVFATMIGIKLARLAQLRSGKDPLNEPVADTFKDLANYAVIWASYWDKPCVEPQCCTLSEDEMKLLREIEYLEEHAYVGPGSDVAVQP